MQENGLFPLFTLFLFSYLFPKHEVNGLMRNKRKQSHRLSSAPYRIVVAADNSPISKKAIQYAIQLCSQLAVPYSLQILYAVGLNPTTAPVSFM
jgi:hypothetical protein